MEIVSNQVVFQLGDYEVGVNPTMHINDIELLIVNANGAIQDWIVGIYGAVWADGCLGYPAQKYELLDDPKIIFRKKDDFETFVWKPGKKSKSSAPPETVNKIHHAFWESFRQVFTSPEQTQKLHALLLRIEVERRRKMASALEESLIQIEGLSV